MHLVADAVVGRSRESIAPGHPLEDIQGGHLAAGVVATEPCRISGRVVSEKSQVIEGSSGETLGYLDGVHNHIVLIVVAAMKEGPLSVDLPGDRDWGITGKLDLGSVFNGGVQVLGGAISVDVSGGV